MFKNYITKKKLHKVYYEIISISHIPFKLNDYYFNDRDIFTKYIMGGGRISICVPDNSQINKLRSDTLKVFITNIIKRYNVNVITHIRILRSLPEVNYDKSQMILSIY